MKKASVILVGLAGVLLSACQSTPYHLDQVRAEQSDKALTVGLVQREVRVGMTNTEVVEVLGSPNMVTTDEERREIWVYDKVATESVTS